MTDGKERTKRLVFLVVATVIACFLCFWIARPFTQPILTAAILAILSHPLFVRLRGITGNRNWAAFLSLIVLFVVFAGLITLLVFAIEGEIVTSYRWFKDNTAARDGWTAAFSAWADKASGWIGFKTGISPDVIRTAALTRLDQASTAIIKQAGNLLTSIGTITVFVVLTFFTLFFFLRDGRQLVNRTARLLPLDDDQIEQIIEETQTSIRANVVGVVAVGGVQGLLLGIGFSVLGVPSPLLWALVTCACSVIPFFGAALVWVPGALYLILIGSWVKGLILAGWGAGVVSLSDNIVRPWVISERLRLSPGILFFALLGGVEMFGPLGIFLGPVIVSVTLSLGKMLLTESRQRPAA